MLFSELNQEWEAIPRWAEFLIQFGYRWPGGVSEKRRIVLVSMPCDSAAVGLISLGALIRDLGSPQANDIDGHYDALLRFARQYLENCRDCEMRCRPDSKDCGHTAEATGRVRHRGRKLYRISDRTNLDARRLVYSVKNGTWEQNPRYATDWQIDGEPPAQLITDEGALTNEAYLRIVEGARIIPENLRRSFSGLSFAGRVAGETASRETCASIRLRFASGEHGLPNLLTIHGWSPKNIVSRIAYFNARTEQFDRRASTPSLVIADGDACFLKVLGKREFQRSDVIGVIHRTMERDRLEEVGNCMHRLRQWYVEDSDILGLLPTAPRGISVLILRKRTC